MDANPTGTSAAEGRNPNPSAGVGEARPAEPADARVALIAEHLGYCPHSTAEDEAAGAAVLQLVAECARLREQLDAQTETLRLRSEAWHAQSKNLMDAWGQVSALTGALEAADDLLRRLSEWDALNLLPVEAPYGDAPYWQREIAKTRAAVVAALPKEPDGSRAALGDVAAGAERDG